ncbi:ATP10 protein-domain-containing protein [Amylostereum chailletii]|nr:ATP10 protein-domain-containing protein [Amylostereum chailletii]
MLAAALRLSQPTRNIRRHTVKQYTCRRLSSGTSKAEKPLDDTSDKAVAGDATPEIPSLHRPLGISEPPTTEVKTFSQKGQEFLDRDKVLANRRHLVKEASMGYFHDLHMTRVHGGKTWMAPSVLIREDKALWFPNVIGTRLDNGLKAHTAHLLAGKVSVVSMLTTKISEYHASSYASRVNELYKSHPAYQYVQINLQENVLKSLLVNLFLRSLRQTIPLHLQSTYLVSRQNMEYVREQLGMVSSRIGYVYLVDEKQKVRWAACADAKKEEEEALVRGVGVLLKRHKGAPTPPEAEPPS